MKNDLQNIFNHIFKLEASGAQFWAPIIFIVFLGISFLFGMIFKFKWTILKVIAIIITMVGSIIAYNKIADIVNKHDQNLIGFVPFGVTLIAIAIYWVSRLILFIINLILHVIIKGIQKKKNPIKKRKWLFRILGGFSNLVVTIPGSLLITDVFLVGTKNKTSFGEVTKLGVKLLTSNKGVSLAGLIEKTKNIEKVLNTLTKSDILSKDYSSLSDKEKEELENTLKETAHLINDKRIFNAVVPIITKKAKENNVDKKIDNIVENAIKEIETKDPSYKNASSEKKKEITEKYIKENINKLYENTKREDPKIEDKIKTLETVVGNLNENTKNDLIKEFDKVVPNDGELRKKINVTKTIEIFFDFLKEKNKKENEVKKEETSGINDSNLNDFINNLSGIGSEGGHNV
ncbi:hypothetical protein [Mycoplasmopsis cynos]|uniref:Uncharacterized protein n=1 Tax=Mycoplasmopsis cynos TaxID=171284 RepID=A0ABD8AJ08_9BACT|nr:hypothetical protein [Mycoplasmopsis cynos]MCU9935129.1 hypothetical protein [Mycoplasmopsis cynos]WAM05364.1 hypothetical protein OM999_03160 [Mycoplasmopsis cynos]WQQ20010.1 hypothetical protein RRG46_00425 [Mycoplasmopsis cynos]